MGRVPQLGELLECRAWKVGADAAFDLADWIADRTGCEAMYPAIVGDAMQLLATSRLGGKQPEEQTQIAPSSFPALGELKRNRTVAAGA